MSNREDTVFYAGYGLVVIMLGLMVLLFSMGFLSGWHAFGIWLLSTSLILLGLGSVRTEMAPHGSRMLMGSGLFFLVISIAILGIILELITPLTAIALLILVVGIVVVALGVRRSRSIS